MCKTTVAPTLKTQQINISIIKIDQNVFEKETTEKAEKGISVWATGLLLTGELAGAGMVALPQAIQFLGWLPGLISLLCIALITGYTGTLLGTCWYTLQQQYPEYKNHCKRPFQEIGRRTVGSWMTYLISITIDFTLFGTCVSYLILASQNIHSLLIRWFDADISFCLFLVIVAVCLLPLSFLGSPKDFWQAVVLAMACTTVAFVAIVVGTVLDNNNMVQINTTDHSNHSLGYQNTTSNGHVELSAGDKFTRFFVAFGIVVFAYTGHSVFPVVQQDMKQPEKWSWAVIMAFLLQLVYYIPISFLGNHVYGSDLKDNIIGNMENIWCRSISSLLVTFHVMLSFILMMNPVSHEFEHLFKVENKFGWQRALIRTSIVVAILFVAESIPNFGILLSLFGGTGNALLALVYPPIFYYFLNRKSTTRINLSSSPNKKSAGGNREPLPWYTCLMLLVIVMIGTVLVCGNAYSTIKTMIYPGPGDAFTAPCYVNPWPYK